MRGKVSSGARTKSGLGDCNRFRFEHVLRKLLVPGPKALGRVVGIAQHGQEELPWELRGNGMAWHGMARHALRLPLLGSYEDKLSQKLSHLPPSRSDGRLLYVRGWSRENHLRSNFKTFLFFPQFLEQHQVQKLPYKRCQFVRSRCFVADLCSVPI
jgi:hypothetical protein